MTTTHVAASVPLPPPVARPQDAPLRQDVRWLAATLGRVVGRLAGDETFRAVEDLRRACRARRLGVPRSEEHTSELQSQSNLVCRLLLEKKKKNHTTRTEKHMLQNQSPAISILSTLPDKNYICPHT